MFVPTVLCHVRNMANYRKMPPKKYIIARTLAITIRSNSNSWRRSDIARWRHPSRPARGHAYWACYRVACYDWRRPRTQLKLTPPSLPRDSRVLMEGMDIDLDPELMQKFSCMGTTDKDVLISEFQRLLGFQLNPAGCAFFLDMTNWWVRGLSCGLSVLPGRVSAWRVSLYDFLTVNISNVINRFGMTAVTIRDKFK